MQVSNLYEPKGMPSIRPPQMKPTSSTVKEQNELQEKKRLPPLIRTVKTAESIARTVFTNENDYDDVIKHLQAYQKAGGEWEVYRKKVPNDLLVKFKEFLIKCRHSGFIGPKIENEKLIFRQIVTHNQNADQCTLCERNLVNGSCNGQLKRVNNNRQFVPGWRY